MFFAILYPDLNPEVLVGKIINFLAILIILRSRYSGWKFFLLILSVRMLKNRQFRDLSFYPNFVWQ